MDIVLIGPENSGKSYFVKCLKKRLANQSRSSDATSSRHESKSPDMTLNAIAENAPLPLPYEPNEATAATIGVDMTDFTLNGKDFKITELGGTLVSGWHTYYKNCSAVIYMIDIADPGAWPPAMVYLYEAITYKQLDDKPLVIVLNKEDITDQMTVQAGIKTMWLNTLRDERSRTSMLVGSCFDVDFIDSIVEWIRAQVLNPTNVK